MHFLIVQLLKQLKTLRNSLIFAVFRWNQRFHLYLVILILSLASWFSYQQPFGLLFTVKHILPTNPVVLPKREQLIIQQKEKQRVTYEWLEQLRKNPNKYPLIISNKTQRSRFYDFMQNDTPVSNLSSYVIFNRPVQSEKTPIETIDEPVLVSILYSQQDTDYRQGKFYVGQVLQQLLKYYHRNFIVTLCENNNTAEHGSDTIEIIRQLVPVFIVNTVSSNSPINIYEQEKQAHVQCILANFQSFPRVNHFLLLQDDAEPVDEYFYDNLLFLIRSRFKNQWPPKGTRQQPGYVKIYHPKWLNGYFPPSVYNISQLLATTLFLLFVLTYLLNAFKAMIFFSNSSRISRYSTTQFSNYFVNSVNIPCRFVHSVFYFFLIMFALILLNHCNISWPWRSLHPSLYAIRSAPSCCLPGVIYFRETYFKIIDYLSQIECNREYPIDTALDELPKRRLLQTYLVEPNLVHHIGLYSRLRKNYINPYLLD